MVSILKMRRTRAGRERAELRLKKPLKNSGLTKTEWAREWLEAYAPTGPRPERLEPYELWLPPWHELEAKELTLVEWY